MTTMEIGKQLVELCGKGKNEEAMKSLYAKDIVAIEAGAPPGMSPESKGLDAVLGKSKWWADNHIVHSAKVEGPWPHGDRFAVRFTYDITQKATNKRVTMDEIALYTIANGKIVREEFFYAMG
ncbi:MAG TPA: nuclear transport factor 2 family protein [Kofleriaceae bacterium]|nr:nuclear transport factor 2 family protein [Kofleriaceae bacterium]